MSISDGPLTSLALCWRLERSDGAGVALTSHDNRVIIGSVNCEPAPGMLPASVSRSLGLEPGSGEIGGALSTRALQEGDLTLGRWDGAEIVLEAVDWTELSADRIRLLAGTLGTVSSDGSRFTAELNGAAARLEEPVCPATSPECRAHFGDKRCQVDLGGRITKATVVARTGTVLTLDRNIDERFVLGRLRYLDGANCGLTTTALAVNGNTVQVRDLPRAEIEPGCRVELREGCDKRFETCTSRFNNAPNFRGEPHLPGNDLLTRYPGA